MNAATASEIARLKTLTITQIVRQFESLFGEKCRSRNKRYLIRRIAWRLQANAEGDLSERAKARAAELALDSDGACGQQSKPIDFGCPCDRGRRAESNQFPHSQRRAIGAVCSFKNPKPLQLTILIFGKPWSKSTIF
jgi:hypothetical protein